MSQLQESQQREIEQWLAAREQELGAEIRAAREAKEERPSAQGPQVDDEGELGEERTRTGIEHVEVERDRLELRAIEEARSRIAQGTYGECADCGDDIAFERLRAQPIASRCLECQAIYERNHDVTPRYTN